MKPGQLINELAEFRLAGEQCLFPEDVAVAAEVERLVVGDLGVPRITNEFWPARQRGGHSLHELSYRGCFKAELPRFFIERLTEPGDHVLDPFMGRGTTLLEAALLGRVPIGNDINPLSRILLGPRLEPPDASEVDARLAELWGEIADARREPAPDEPDLSVFYERTTLAEIRALRDYFIARGDACDRIDRWVRMVASNRLTGHSPGFFSVRTMPPNQAVSIETQRRLNERADVTPERRDVRALISRKTSSLLRDLDRAQRSRLESVASQRILSTGLSDRLDEIPDASIQCTVTSPPFLDVVDYAKDNWLRCWFNGVDTSQVASQIRSYRKLEDWSAFIAGTMAELYRVTRPGGWVVFEVGEVRGGRLRLEEPVLPVASDAGFEPVAVAIHQQQFTKTANCWGVANNKKGTNTNRLVLLHKAAARRR